MSFKKAEIAESITSKDIVKSSDSDAKFFRALEHQGVFLNRQQVQAVRHVNKPALVLAAAGSGKTSVLTNRVCRLITVENVDPKKIMLLTFTKKAAEEMIERLGKLPNMSRDVANKVTAGTFHSVFLSILRQNGIDQEIWSSTKSKEITIKTIQRKLGLDEMEPEVVLSQISSYKNLLIDVEDAPKEDRYQRDFILIWQEYESHKIKNKLIDFDDMLILTHKLFKSNPEILEKVRNKFDYILIDEFQDTNHAQFELAKMIAYPKNNLFVVGDDFQLIYSWNGAKSENILNFKEYYPDVKIIPLEINYRSSDYIVGLGSDIIKDNTKQMKKNVYSVKSNNVKPAFIQSMSAEEEAANIVDQIQEAVTNKETKYKEYAILYRNNSNARAIFDELLIRKIPFVQFGSDIIFYEDPVVKPVLSYLRLTLKPNDTKSIEQILPTLYLKKDLVKHISREQMKNPISHPIEHALSSDMKPFQVNKVREKINLIKRLTNYKPIVAIKTIREDYERYLIGDDDSEEKTLHKEIIKETLDELEASSARFETIEEYISFVNAVIRNSIIQKEMQKNPNSDSVKLMTIHRSKGLEFERVFIIHCSEDIIPSAVALEECKDVIPGDNGYDPLEEERRLMYVGITRAKEYLTISSIQMYRGRVLEPSRFIKKYIK